MEIADDENEGKGEAKLLLLVSILDNVGRKDTVVKVEPNHVLVEVSLLGLIASVCGVGLSDGTFLDVWEALHVQQFTAVMPRKFSGGWTLLLDSERWRGRRVRKDG